MLANNIDDDGAEAIANALESNTTLTTIDLSSMCFECRVCVYHWLMHVNRESRDWFRWWQSDRNGIATQHNVDIGRSCAYVLPRFVLDILMFGDVRNQHRRRWCEGDRSCIGN
jgi:hypothetical protein